MKTQSYNPSHIEVEFAHALEGLRQELEDKLSSKITKVINRYQEDNPVLTFHLKDQDGDPHQVVIKIIQKPDQF